MRTSLSRLLAALVTAGTLSACAQGEGDRCQLDTDCQDGLVCAVPAGMRNSGGTCQKSGAGQDFAAIRPSDFSGSLMPDMTVPDMEMPDLGPPDLVMPDLVMPDFVQPGG